MMKNSNRFILKSLLYILCAVIPCVAFYFVAEFCLESVYGKANCENIVKIRNELIKLSKDGSDEVFIQRLLNSAFGLLQEEKINADNIDKTYLKLKNQGLGFAHFRFFDSDSAIIPIKDDSELMKTVVQKIYMALSEYDSQTDKKAIIKNKTYFNALFGNINPFEVAERKSELFECSIRGKPGYFYWNIFLSNEGEKAYNGGMAAWFAKDEIPSNFSIKQLIDRKNIEKSGNAIFGYYSFNDSSSIYPQDLMKKKFSGLNEIYSNLNKLVKQNESCLRTKNNYLITEMHSGNLFLFCIANSDILSNLREGLFLLKVFLFVLCFVFVKIFINDNSPTASMPICLIVTLFLNILTLYCIGYVGRDFLKSEDINQIKNELLVYAKNVDKNYELFKCQLEDEYKKICNQIDIFDLTKTDGFFSKLKAENKIDRVYVANRAGSIVYTFPKSSGEDIISQMIKPVANKIYNEHFATESTWKDKITNAMMEKAVKSFTSVLEDGSELLRPFETINRINEFWFTNKRYYVYSTFLKSNKNKEPFLMVIWQRTGQISSDYLRQQIDKTRSDKSLSDSVLSVMIDARGGEMPYPPDFSKYKFISELKDGISLEQNQISVTAQIAAEKYIVTGSVLRSIPNKLFAVLKPIGSIEKKYDNLFYLIIFSCLSSFIGLILSYLKFK